MLSLLHAYLLSTQSIAVVNVSMRQGYIEHTPCTHNHRILNLSFRLFAQSLEENIVQSARTREVDVIDPGKDRKFRSLFRPLTGGQVYAPHPQTPRTKQSWSQTRAN
jgi:hypothetical protein